MNKTQILSLTLRCHRGSAPDNTPEEGSGAPVPPPPKAQVVVSEFRTEVVCAGASMARFLKEVLLELGFEGHSLETHV